MTQALENYTIDTNDTGNTVDAGEHANQQRLLLMLSQDHRAVIACVEILEGALTYEGNEEQRATMIAAVADQIFAGPDDFHHLFERRLYRLVWNRVHKFLPRYFDLYELHEERRRRLKGLTPYFKLGSTEILRNPEARDAVASFCQCVRSHIAIEEQKFFPLLRKYLTAGDWTAAEGEFEAYQSTFAAIRGPRHGSAWNH